MGKRISQADRIRAARAQHEREMRARQREMDARAAAGGTLLQDIATEFGAKVETHAGGDTVTLATVGGASVVVSPSEFGTGVAIMVRHDDADGPAACDDGNGVGGVSGLATLEDVRRYVTASTVDAQRHAAACQHSDAEAVVAGVRAILARTGEHPDDVTGDDGDALDAAAARGADLYGVALAMVHEESDADPIILEATCRKCGETFNPADAGDLVHIARADGEACGGFGTYAGAYGGAR